MSACRQQVHDAVDACKAGGRRFSDECRVRSTIHFQRCVEYEEQTYQQCDQWKDEGTEQCTAWEECGWTNLLACIGGFLCIAWEWVENLVCKAWVWITSTVCKTLVRIEMTICVGLAVAANVTCEGVGIFLGVGCRVVEALTSRIAGSWDEPRAESAPKYTAEAMSVADVTESTAYRDSGTHFLFRIEDGRVHFRTPDSGWELLAPDGECAQAVSYHSKRDGEVAEAPPFDMVAANSGRVFVKEVGVARFYFTMLQPMFRLDESRSVPSMYFKLDPEQGIPDADNQDRLDHLAVPDSLHPAAVRFPLFRHAMQIDFNDTMVVNVDRHLRKWHRIDGRPPLLGGEPPSGDGFPKRRPVVAYRSNIPLFGGVTEQLGYSVTKVLDIGVGHAHWHEQRCSIYGGEMDSLDGRGLPPCLEGRNAYRLFNGPVEDQGGFIDNTINYYVLAQFEDGNWRDDEDVPANAFGVLWLDEQAVLSERWRLLDPADSNFGSFKDVVPSAIVQYLDKDFWFGSFQFDRSKFWCPMRAGHVTPRSRMAVSRSVVVVSGRDPNTKQWELYSINFSFGTADRTWRWRPLPWLGAAEAGSPPEPFGLREDMTLYVKETCQNGVFYWYQKYLPACLSSPDDDLKLKKKREGDAAPDRVIKDLAKPSRGYEHLWRCLPQEVFWFIHTRKSHFGCYEPSVNWRWQYYVVTVLEGEEILRATSEDVRWFDVGDQLYILKDAINWERLNHILRGGSDDEVSADLVARVMTLAGAIPGGICGAISSEASKMLFGALSTARNVGPIRTVLCQIYDELRGSPLIRHRHRESLFQAEYPVALHFRKPIGWIMTHADKRDDDLLPFRDMSTKGGTPFELRLRRDNQRDVSVRVRVERYCRVLDAPRVEAAAVFLSRSGSGPQSLQVRIRPCDDEALDENVWRIKLGCLSRNAAGAFDGFEILLDEIRVDAPRQWTEPHGWRAYEWDFAGLSEDAVARLERACSEEGPMKWGTSLWFQDVVGHVATADRVEMSQRGFGGGTLHASSKTT